MKSNIKNVLLKIIFFFIYLCCIFKFYKTIALLIKISLRKVKLIKQNNSGKVFFILHKSNGTEEIINAYRNKKSKNIFFELKRNTLKIICNYFVKGLDDYNYKSYLKDHDKKKEQYRRVLEIIFKELKKTTKLSGIINFNIFYKSDFELAKVCKKINIKFITFHKEGIHTPYQSKNAIKIYKYLNENYSGDKIAVGNYDEKQRIIKAGILEKKKITVVGSPRINYFFNSGSNRVKKNVKIVFFQYTQKRGNEIYKNKNIRNWYDTPDTSWNKTELKCIKSLIDLCKKYPKKIEVIFKVRQKVYKIPKIFSKIETPKNFIISSSPTAYKFITNSNIVLSYNSSTLIEAMAAKKLVILPYFHGRIDWNKCIDVRGVANILKTENKFKIFIETFINDKKKFLKIYSEKSKRKARKRIIDKYFFNSDGNAGKRMINFLEN